MTLLSFTAEHAAPQLDAIIAEANRHPLVDQGGMRCRTIGESVILEVKTDRVFTADRIRKLMTGQFSQFGFTERST